MGFPSIADLRAYPEMYCFRYFVLGEWVECWFAPASYADMHVLIMYCVSVVRPEQAVLLLFSDNGYLVVETY
jgi:hypothetical protein